MTGVQTCALPIFLNVERGRGGGESDAGKEKKEKGSENTHNRLREMFRSFYWRVELIVKGGAAFKREKFPTAKRLLSEGDSPCGIRKINLIE